MTVGERVGEGGRSVVVGRRGEGDAAVRVPHNAAVDRALRADERQSVAVDVDVVAEQGRGGDRYRRVLVGRGGVVHSHRRMVSSVDVHGDRVRALVEIEPAIGGAAVILYLEGEARVARAGGVWRRDELEIAIADRGGRDERTCGHWRAAERQSPRCRQRANLHSQQVVRRRFIRISVTKVRYGKRIHRVFLRGHRPVRTRRRVVHRCDVERERMRALVEVYTASCGAAIVPHLEGKRGVRCTVRIRTRGEYEFAAGDVGCGNEVARVHCHAAVLERAGARHGGDLHRRQIVGWRVVRIAETEVGRGERVGLVLQRGDGLVGSRWRVVYRGNRHPHRRQIRVQPAVVRPVGEAVLPIEIRGRRVGERAVDIQRNGPVRRVPDYVRREHRAVDVGVVGEHVDHDRRVLRRAGDIVLRDRRVVQWRYTQAHRADVRERRAVIDGISKFVETEETCLWRVGEAAVRIHGQRAVCGIGDYRRQQRVAVRISIVGHDVEPHGGALHERRGVVHGNGLVVDRDAGAAAVVVGYGCRDVMAARGIAAVLMRCAESARDRLNGPVQAQCGRGCADECRRDIAVPPVDRHRVRILRADIDQRAVQAELAVPQVGDIERLQHWRDVGHRHACARHITRAILVRHRRGDGVKIG